MIKYHRYELIKEIMSLRRDEWSCVLKFLQDIKSIKAARAVCRQWRDVLKEQYADRVNWNVITKKRKLPEEFIRRHIDRISTKRLRGYISRYQKLSEAFLNEFPNKIRWYLIARYQSLTERFMVDNLEKLNECDIQIYQILSEDFIRKLGSKVRWYFIMRYQKLSEEFILEFMEKKKPILSLSSMENIYLYQDVSEDFIRRFPYKQYTQDYNWPRLEKVLSEKRRLRRYSDHSSVIKLLT